VKKEVQHFARQSMVGVFAEIAREHYECFLQCELQLAGFEEKLAQRISDDDRLSLNHEVYLVQCEQNKHGVIVIVFSALAVEAYIYDYAARNVSDSFAKKYLDKLDTVSKWVVIPRLATGNSFPTASKGFALLRSLIRARNNIVHHKSSRMPVTEQELKEFAENFGRIQEEEKTQVREAIAALDELAAAMESIDPNEPASVHLHTDQMPNGELTKSIWSSL
jgi:hypothetical protein